MRDALRSPVNYSLQPKDLKRLYMKPFRFGILTILLLVSILFPSTAAPYHTSLTSSLSNEPHEILIGGTIPVTGPYSRLAGPFKKLAESWQELINEQGGIWVEQYAKKIPIRFIIYDDGSDSNRMLELYERLITEDRVHLLIGPFGSDLSYSAATVAELHRIPMVMVEAGDKKLFNRNYKWSVSQLAEAEEEHSSFIRLIAAKKDINTIAMIGEGGGHAVESLDGAARLARKMGLKVLFKKNLPGYTAAKELSPVIRKIKSLRPDVVMIEGYHDFEVKILWLMLKQKLRPEIVYCGNITRHLSRFINRLKKLGSDIYTSVRWSPRFRFAGQKDFMEILQMTGITWSQYELSSVRMQAFQTIKMMIETAGSLDRKKLNRAMHETEYMTISGKVSHGEGGIGTTLPFAVKIK